LRYEDTLHFIRLIITTYQFMLLNFMLQHGIRTMHTPLTEYLHTHVRPVHTYARVRSSIINKELTVKRAVPLLLSQRLFHIAHLPLALNWVTCHFYRSFPPRKFIASFNNALFFFLLFGRARGSKARYFHLSDDKRTQPEC